MTSSTTDVLFLSHRYEITSGGEKALLDLIEYVVSTGLKAHVVIGGNGSIVPYLEQWDVPYTIVHLPFWAHGGEDSSPFIFDQPFNPINNTTLQLVNLLNELKPRLCATNTIVVPWLAYAAAITNTPHSWMIHELDTSGLNLQYAIDLNQILRTIDILSDRIFYNSKYTAQHYLPKFTLNKDVSVVYPGGKLQDYENTPSPFTTSAMKIINVGQIKQQKGQIDAVKAGIRLHRQGVDFEMIFIGGVNSDDKPYMDTLTDLVDKADVADKIRFLGHSENPVGLMQHSDVAINCATGETFGRVTVEAMLSNNAVVGANSAGTSEIITHDSTGILYSPGNDKELADALLKLQRDPSLIKRLAKKAKVESEKKYSDTERFKPFIQYFESNPARDSLDLSPLSSVFSDFNTLSTQRNGHSKLVSRTLSKVIHLARRILKG